MKILTAITYYYPHWTGLTAYAQRLAEGLFRRPIQRGPSAGIWSNHQRLYERDQLVGLVRRAGFAIECVEELTHYCFPGTRTIVYTLGKGLIEHNLLPKSVSKSTHRFRGQENRGSLLNPVNWMLALFDGIDHLNTDSFRMGTKRTLVNISVKARKN